MNLQNPQAGPSEPIWRSVVPDDVGRAATAVVLQIAGRLRGSIPLETSAVKAEAGAGCAILHGQIDHLLPGEGWAAEAHGSLVAAARIVEQAAVPGLFGGLDGVAFAAHTLVRAGSGYHRLLTTLDTVIVELATRRANRVDAAPRGLPFGAFDVVVGLAGTGAYLLSRRGRPGIDAALDAVLTALVALCGADGDVPNWNTPATALIAGSSMARSFPGGVFNCGVAHGIPGPLALLSLAHRNGVSVAGQTEAIGRVAGWLVEQRTDDEWGPNWPSGTAMGRAGPRSKPTHNAWCYGSTGVARALWLAASATDDAALRDIATDTMLAVYRRPPSARRVDNSPGLCHGLAGVLQVTLRFAHDTGDDRFVTAATTLTRALLSRFEPERTFGYGSLSDNGSIADEPGLLDGAAGVALALLAAGTDIPPVWDRMLLLA